jgi:hypothetical protein
VQRALIYVLRVGLPYRYRDHRRANLRCNIMKITLPTLSYNPIGFVWREDCHSSGEYSKERAFPRTDLKCLVSWDTFEKEINEAITARMSTMNIPQGAEYEISQLDRKQFVVNEGVRMQAEMQLHFVVKSVLDILGMVFPAKFWE